MIANAYNWVPCNLILADSYTPVAESVDYDDVGLEITYRLNGEAVKTKTLTLADWSEGSSGGYAIRFSPAECPVSGQFDYWVSYTGCVPYPGSMVSVPAYDTRRRLPEILP